MSTPGHAITETTMTLEDVDKALENKELTPEQADLLRFDIRAQAYRKRFQVAASRSEGAA